MGENALTMRTRTRHTWALATGAVVSGLLAYLFFALVTRALGSVSAAPVSVLWAYWAFAGAALTFPMQHWIARSVAAQGGEGRVRRALPGVAAVSGALAGVAAVASWSARDALFGAGQPWFPLLVGAVTLGSALMGVVRGVLTARERFAAVAAGLVVENALRCLAAAVLVATGVDDPAAYGLCLVAGYAAALGWPSAFRLARTGDTERTGSPFAFLGGAAGGQAIGQAVLTGGPVVLALAGGTAAEVTSLFAALALFRAPYTVAVALVSQLTGRFTLLVVRRRAETLRRIRHALIGTTMIASSVAAVVGATIAPPVLRLVFGDDVSLPASMMAVLAVGSIVGMANLVATLVVLAQGRTSALVRAWLLALVPGLVWFTVSDLSALRTTCWAFLVVEVSALVLLLVEDARGASRLTARSAAGLLGSKED